MPLDYKSHWRVNVLQVRNKYLLYYQKTDKPKKIDYIKAEPERGDNKVTVYDSNKIDEVDNIVDDIKIEPAFKKAKTYSGNMTKQSQARLKSKIQILLMLIDERLIYNPVLKRHQKFKLNFLTLTIPFNEVFITAKEANEILLKPFLRILRDRYSVNTYIWKAERQSAIDYKGKLKESRGQLHYHIILPNAIHYNIIKREWNKLLFNCRYNVNALGNSLSDYNPNSTDIHSMISIKDMEDYLVKYTSKMPYTHIIVGDELVELDKSDKGNYIIPYKLNEGERLVNCVTVDNTLHIIESSIEGKVWDCSLNLKKACFYEFVINTYNEKKLLNKSKENSIKQTNYEWANLIYLNTKEALNLMDGKQKMEFEKWRKELSFSVSIKDSM